MSSRANSPTPPSCSPLTPKQDIEEEQYLEMREQEADYDEYLRSLQHSSSDEDDEDDEDEDEDESTASEMPTDARGDTVVLSSDDTSQTLQPEQKGSDRAAEFDEETARKRQAARDAARERLFANDNAEEVHAGQSGGELKRAPTGPEENDTRQEQVEKNGEKEVAVEKPMEPKFERAMTPPRSQASWVSDAVAACKANTEVRFLKSHIARFQQS
jgi:hypothetical protein